jgi:formate hydrogenlyase subunit 6/NADH:ubiquinone oxidoreductase subunit I
MTGQYLSGEKLAKALADERCLWSAAGEQAGPRETIAGLTGPRSSLSPKGWLYPSLQSVGRYGDESMPPPAEAPAPRAIVGLRACELSALKYLDKMLLDGPFQEPVYQSRRKSSVLVSTDCAAAAPTCFCTSVGGLPFAADGYDVNLSPVEGGFIVDAATDRGRAWLETAGIKCAAASAEQLARRDSVRRSVAEAVESQNRSCGLQAAQGQSLALPDDGDPSWQRYAADCVECGACTNICPTCYCFYLYDQALGPGLFERVRTWDSCLLGTYHRMAGTTPNMKPTPRPRLRSRLANRVLHKFTYAPAQCGLLGCVGCGRCIEACLGAIDIRQVAGELRR